jgi:hypothetical protein
LPLTPENIGLALHNLNKAAKRSALPDSWRHRLYAIKEVVIARAVKAGVAKLVGYHQAGTRQFENYGEWQEEAILFACYQIDNRSFHQPADCLPAGQTATDLGQDWQSPRTNRSQGTTLANSLATLRAYLNPRGELLDLFDRRFE